MKTFKMTTGGGGQALLRSKQGVKRALLYILTPVFCVALCVGAVFLSLNKDNKVTANAAVAVAQSVFTGTCVGKYSKADDNPTNLSYATVAASNSTAGTLSFTPGTGAMSASSSKANNTLAYIGYIAFQADIEVPAYTEYKITYEFNLGISATKTGTTNASVMTELLYFGDSEHGGSNQTSSLKFTCGSTSCNATYSQKRLSGTVNYSSSAVVVIPEITYTNNTGNPLPCTAYFGYNSANNYNGGAGSKMTVNTTLSLKKETVVATEVDASVDVDSITYDGNNHNFTFTYDNVRTSVTKAEYVNVAGTKTTTFNRATSTGTNPLDSSGVMTAKEAGTYTLYFDINADCGAVWDTTTNDQDTKTVSFTIKPVELNVPQTVTTDYNGGNQTLNSLTTKPSWYDNLLYTDTAVMTVSPATVKDANETGHTVTVTIVSNNYVWKDKASNAAASRTFAFKVNRKALTVSFETKDGLEVAKFSDESQIFTSDKDGVGKPTFTLKTKYYEAGSSPSSAVDAPTGIGNWVAIAVLEGTGATNYKVDATKSFTNSKKAVAYPAVSGNASEEYDGTSQEFTLTGYDGDIMTYTVPAGADSFDGETLKVTNAGKYTPVFTLKNPTMYEWKGTAPSVEITPKPVVVSSDGGNATEWQRKTKTTLTFDVPTALCGSDSTLNFEAAYTLNGDAEPVAVKASDISVSGTTCTVTIGTGYAKGVYALTVKIADGENYSGSVTHNFEITAQGLSLGSNDIKWNIAGKTFIADDYDDGSAVYEMEYTGTPLGLSNVSVNFNSASDAPNLEQDGPLTGTFIDAVDVGTYTATFAIKAKSGGEYTCDDGPFTITIKIVPKKLDFTNAEWEYSSDGGANWTKFTASNKPSYTGNAVTVRISPDYMKSIGLDPDNGDYTESYTPLNNASEQGAKTTNVELTINNGNYTTADESGYVMIPYNWEITARALSYGWTTQTVEAGGNAFEFPAITFDDGGDYSQYYEYVYTVNGTEYTLDELKAYIAENWSETNSVSGTVTVRMKDGVTEVNIPAGSRSFTTGTPKTALTVEVTGSGAEYGLVDFAFSVIRNGNDERARTSVVISGGALTEAKSFDGNSPELVAFVNGLGVGNYVITVSLKAGNEDSYVLTKSVFDFEVLVRKIIVPQVTGEITFNGEYINIVDYLDSNYNADIMSMLSGYTNKTAGSYTVTFKLNSNNYMWVEPTSAEPMNKLLAKAVLFDNEISINNPELTATLGWTINKIVLATDSWNLKSKTGASLNALAAYQEMITASGLDVAIAYRYYDTNGNLIEEPVLKGGDKYIVEAYIVGEDAANFEFADGTDEAKSVSAQKEYTVPQSAAAKFFGSAVSFAKANWLWLVIAAVVLLFLIILICIIASAKKKKRKREELAEQRRLEEKEEKKREQEERRLEREERMARMSQQQAMPQMMMPQMMQMPQMQMPQQPPQYAPQVQGQPAAAGGGTVSEAQFLQMQAELKAEISALKAEQSAKEIAALRAEVALRDDISVLRSEGGRQQAGMNVEAMTEIMTMALKNVLAAAQPALAAQPAQPAQLTDGGSPAATPNAPAQIPPDAVMTTVTTTKIDTTKKPVQSAPNADRAAAPAPAGRTVVRNFVAPMPVDDGRVFDVGGFYKPADPVTDGIENLLGEEPDKKE